MFQWESPSKRPEDIISVFKSELHWKTKPQFTVVGKNVLAFMNFCVRRTTLERGLADHGIEMSYVKPDLKAAEHILGIRLEVDDPTPVCSEGHNDATAPNAQSPDVISSSELMEVAVLENAGNDVSHADSNEIVSYSGNIESAMLNDYSHSDQQSSNLENEEVVVVDGYFNSDDNIPLSRNEDTEIVVVSLDDCFADDE